MVFSMRWIESALGAPVLSRQGEDRWDEADLSGWEPVGGGETETGVLLAAEAAAFSKTLPEGTAMVCAGEAPDAAGDRVLSVALSFSELVGRLQKFFRHFDTLEKKLTEAAMLRRSIPELTELMAGELGGELCVISSNHRLVTDSMSGELLRESRLPEIGINGYLPGELVNFLRTDETYLALRSRQGVWRYEKGLLCCDVLGINVFFQGSPVCRCVHSSLHSPLHPWNNLLLECFAGYVQTVYELTGDEKNGTPQSRLRRTLQSLLDGERVEPETVDVALQERGWRREGPFVCLCLLPSQGDYSLRLSAPYYCRLIAGELAGVCVFEQGKYILCLAELSLCGGTASGFMERSVEFFRDNQFLAGISNEFEDLASLAGYWRQATAALEVGLEEHPTFWYHRFSDLALSYLLRKATSELDERFLCAPELLKLRDYDRDNGTEYLNTLTAYLYHGCNAVQTARSLFIHRGTMIYRLRRIWEITGLNMDSFERRLYLGISCLLLSGNASDSIM